MAKPFVMAEDDWLDLCLKQCKARRKTYPEDTDCERNGMCSECIYDAAELVPAKYRTTAARAKAQDPLPGFDERDFEEICNG